MVTSSLTDAQLFWNKSFPEGRYELTGEGQPLAWLQHGEYWSAESQARFGEHSLLFRRPGSSIGHTELVEGDSPAPLASYKSHWGGGTLTFSDGNRYLLSCTGVWHHLWTLLDSTGDVVLRIEPKVRKVVVSHGPSLLRAGEDRDRLLLLVVFVWHEILQARDEAEMVANMSATS
ncbi:MAG: hypothetical protein ACM3SW_16595 [Actinomycetota bacterium]